MVAKKCNYEAAKKTCQKMLKDYWDVDMDSNGDLEGKDGSLLDRRSFHSLRLQGGRHGGQATLCVSAR